MRLKKFVIFACLFLTGSPLFPKLQDREMQLPVKKVEVERLPQLNIPRTGHHTFFVGGEALVVGGHTSGFVLTKTAEYYKGGRWHLLNTVYAHDHALALRTKEGNVIVAGGHEKDLGVGQTFSVEKYLPSTHSFQGFGCLDRKRCFADAVEIDSGNIIITGNWYHDDGCEQTGGSNLFQSVCNVSQSRSCPYIFRTGKNKVMTFSSCDNRGKTNVTIRIDRLDGTCFTVPLFNQWRPFYCQVMARSSDSFIGDETNNEYAYLFTAVNQVGQLALVKTEGERFDLLKTDCPMPVKGVDGEKIAYFSYVTADTLRKKAYVMGFGENPGKRRLYVLNIQYKERPAKLSLAYTDPMDSIGLCQPVIDLNGNLIMAGGTLFADANSDNFNPQSTALVIYTSTSPENKSSAWPLIAVFGVLALVTLTYCAGLRKRKKPMPERFKTAERNEQDTLQKNRDDFDKQLFEQLCELMEEEKLFLNPDLKMQDVANRLSTNRTYLANCVKNLANQTFTQFISKYRINYSMQLLENAPEKKIIEIATEVGFNNEISFYRKFKEIVGMTPTEWRIQKTSEG